MSKFGQALKFFENENNKIHKQNIATVENYVYNQLRAKSPVDSGAYRSNHNRTIGAPLFTFRKGTTNSIQPAPVPAGTIFNMYVSNGAPYATKIEEGHSGQAPSGVYSLAYQSAKNKYGI